MKYWEPVKKSQLFERLTPKTKSCYLIGLNKEHKKNTYTGLHEKKKEYERKQDKGKNQQKSPIISSRTTPYYYQPRKDDLKDSKQQ